MTRDHAKGFRDRFNPLSDTYARFRPQYPGEMVDDLADRITGVPLPLAKALPPGIRIVGIEPAEKMRDAAFAQSHGFDIEFIEGTAEPLPAGEQAVRAVVAATAAHWFERPQFYAEVKRVMIPGGILAIIEYVRDTENSPAAEAIENFLAQQAGPKAYERPDYAAELSALSDFSVTDTLIKTITLPLDVDGFVGLALSSSHAKAVVDRLGETATRSALSEIGAKLVGIDGRRSYGYRFSWSSPR